MHQPSDQERFLEGSRGSSASWSSAIGPIPLVLKQVLGIICALQVEKVRRLRIGAVELFNRRMQTVGQVIATSYRQGGFYQLTGHARHVLVCLLGPGLVKEHHQGKQVLIGIAQKSLLIRRNKS